MRLIVGNVMVDRSMMDSDDDESGDADDVLAEAELALEGPFGECERLLPLPEATPLIAAQHRTTACVARQKTEVHAASVTTACAASVACISER